RARRPAVQAAGCAGPPARRGEPVLPAAPGRRRRRARRRGRPRAAGRAALHGQVRPLGELPLGDADHPQGAGRAGARLVGSRQVRLMRDLGAEILLCTPSYAARLGGVVVEEGIDPDELSLRAGLFGAEPWSEAMRRQVEALLGLKALDIYGLSEVVGPGVSAECVEAQAGLHVNEDHFLVEVVDPSSRRPL